MHIDLRSLRYFVAVAEELHFARAALRLHMTQPPLSQAIQALELALGHALFLRNKRHVALTPAGLALLPEARRLLHDAEQLPGLVARAASGESGRLSLAFVSTVDYSVLPPLLRQFRQRFPQVEIELREATSDLQLEDLQQGRIDAGLLIAPLPKKMLGLLDYRCVLQEPLVLALPGEFVAMHPALHAPTSAAQLLALASALPLIIFPRRIAPALHDAILTCFRNASVTPLIGQQAIQMQTIVSLVSNGLGMALVPQSVSNLQRPGVQYFPLQDASHSVETGLAWRRNHVSPVLQGFLQVLDAMPPF